MRKTINHNEFSKIVLFNKERLYLFHSRFQKVPKNEYTQYLYEIGFLKPIPTGEIGKYRNRIYSNYFEISKEGKRYSKFIHQDRINRFLTPIVVSVLTTIATNIAIYLLQHLLS